MREQPKKSAHGWDEAQRITEGIWYLHESETVGHSRELNQKVRQTEALTAVQHPDRISCATVTGTEEQGNTGHALKLDSVTMHTTSQAAKLACTTCPDTEKDTPSKLVSADMQRSLDEYSRPELVITQAILLGQRKLSQQLDCRVTFQARG